MNPTAMLEWIVGDDTGVSSKTMWAAIIGVKPSDADIPYDAADFGRCYRLFKKAKLTKEDLGKVAKQYPFWQPIVKEWDKICKVYDEKRWNDVYDLLKAQRDEIMALKGYTRSGNNQWVNDKSTMIII